jgi:hypothetical protein
MKFADKMGTARGLQQQMMQFLGLIGPFVFFIGKPLLFYETYMRHGDVQGELAIIYTYVWIIGKKYITHNTVGVLRNCIFAILPTGTIAH